MSRRQGARSLGRDGIVALALAYVIVLHVLLGAYAQASMLGDGPRSPLFVLCDPYGLAAHQDATSEASSELNHLLCKSACALGTALPGTPPGVMPVPGESVFPQGRDPAEPANRWFVRPYSRAPPSIASTIL